MYSSLLKKHTCEQTTQEKHFVNCRGPTTGQLLVPDELANSSSGENHPLCSSRSRRHWFLLSSSEMFSEIDKLCVEPQSYHLQAPRTLSPDVLSFTAAPKWFRTITCLLEKEGYNGAPTWEMAGFFPCEQVTQDRKIEMDRGLHPTADWPHWAKKENGVLRPRQEQQWIGLWGGKQMEFSWAKGTKNSVTFSKRLSWYYRMWLQSIYFNSNWRAQSQGHSLGQSQCRWQDAHPAPGTSKSYNRSHLPIFLMDTPPGIPSLLPYT